jgi:hypothetical protein
VFLVVPRRITRTSVEVFLGAFGGDEPPDSAVLHLDGSDPTRSLPVTDLEWSSLEGGSAAPIHYCLKRFDDLVAGTAFELDFVDGRQQSLATGRVETLPAVLPVGDQGGGPHRPFSVWLSSCFHAPRAHEGLEAMAREVFRDARIRPHLKILSGDQVYLDVPQSLTLLLTPPRLRRHFNQVYTRTFTHPGFAELLRGSATYFMSDDHEFWDNYPETNAGYALRSAKFWSRWHALALERCVAMQGGHRVQRVDIGTPEAPELSMFLMDTRLDRSPRRLFLVSDETLRAFQAWIAGLSGPGVVAVSQTLVSRLGHSSTARLQDFRQFRQDILPALRRTRHDIVVLSGDAHAGHIAVAKLNANHRLIEVVASPLALVTPTVGTDRPEQPEYFPQFGPASEWSSIEYPRTVPSYLAGRKKLSEEHGMLLSFFKPGPASREVNMRVTLHLARAVSEADAWTWETTLS